MVYIPLGLNIKQVLEADKKKKAAEAAANAAKAGASVGVSDSRTILPGQTPTTKKTGVVAGTTSSSGSINLQKGGGAVVTTVSDNKVIFPGQTPASTKTSSAIVEKERQQEIYSRLNDPNRTDVTTVTLNRPKYHGEESPIKPLEKYETYTKTAYIQKTESTHKKAVAQFEEFLKQKRQIDENAYYIDPLTGKTISGAEVLKRYYSEQQYQQLSLQAGQALQNYNQAQTVPDYADIQGTSSGDSFKISVNPVEKERAEWKTLNPAQQFGKSLYVGATRWPELIYEQIPVLGDQNTTKLAEKWIVDEGQLWDKAQKKDYGAVAWDAASSPAMVEVYTTLATMGIAKAAPIAARGAIKGGAKAYGKLSNFIPEENILSKGLTKSGQKIVSTEVGENVYKWGTKGYRFGYQAGSKTIAKGGVNFVDDWTRIESVPSKTVIGGSRAERILMSPEQQGIAKQTLNELTAQKGGTSVSWRLGQTDVILESNYKRSMFGNKLVKQSTRISGSFVDEPLEQPAVSLASEYGGFENVSSRRIAFNQAERSFYHGVNDEVRIFDKKLQKFITLTKETEDELLFQGIGETYLKPYVATYKEPMKLRLLGYNVSAEKKALNFQFGMAEAKESVWVKYKKLVQPTFVTPGTRTSKIQAFKNMVIPVGENTEGVLQKGVYKTAGDPLKEIYAKEAKAGVELFKKQHPIRTFLADTKASLQTVITDSRTVFTSKTEGKTSSAIAARMPKPYYLPSNELGSKLTIGGIETIFLTGAGEINKRIERLSPKTSFIQEENERMGLAVIPVSSVKQAEATKITPATITNYKSIQAQEIFVKQLQIQDQKYSYDAGVSYAKINRSNPQTITKAPPVPMFLPYIPKLRGRGGQGFDWEYRQQKYKFRKANIGLPSFDFKPMKVKI